MATEAMASGLPVVAYVAEGVRDHVEHVCDGLLAPEGDRAAFIRYVGRALGDEALRARMGVAARASAAQREWPVILEALLESYRDTRASAGRPVSQTA